MSRWLSRGVSVVASSAQLGTFALALAVALLATSADPRTTLLGSELGLEGLSQNNPGCEAK